MSGAALGEPELARLRAVLLGLLAGEERADLADVDEAGWLAIDRMAALHRLQPLLHHNNRDNPAIPPAIRAAWQDAHRRSAVEALVAAGEQAHAVRLLEQAGLAPLALKGAWLAWHAYPRAGLRPMRDIDLLLTPETVVQGFDLLLANGYKVIDPQQLPTEEIVRLDKHMPPLLSPRGVVIELHQRLWEIDGRMDHTAPAADLAAIRARAVRKDGASFLDPGDLLAHLIIHAVYDHRLDCGPLVLSDIAWLLRTSPVDWDRFWAEARRGQWLRGAGLVLALVHSHAPDLVIPLPGDLPALPPDYAALSAALLLQDLDTRQSAGFVATMSAGGTMAVLRRMFARRGGKGDAHVRRDLSAEGGFAAWAGSRLIRTVRELARPDVRRQSRGLARLSRWLDA